MVAYLPQYCGIVRQICDEGDKTLKKADQKHRRRLQTFRWQLSMRRLCTKTRPCRHCARPLTPGSFWGRHTMCKACHVLQCKVIANKSKTARIYQPVVRRICRTCPIIIKPGSEYHIPGRRICKECKHAYDGKRYAHMMSAEPPTWVTSEAYAARSFELALAMINRKTPQ